MMDRDSRVEREIYLEISLCYCQYLKVPGLLAVRVRPVIVSQRSWKCAVTVRPFAAQASKYITDTTFRSLLPHTGIRGESGHRGWGRVGSYEVVGSGED